MLCRFWLLKYNYQPRNVWAIYQFLKDTYIGSPQSHRIKLSRAKTQWPGQVSTFLFTTNPPNTRLPFNWLATRRHLLPLPYYMATCSIVSTLLKSTIEGLAKVRITTLRQKNKLDAMYVSIGIVFLRTLFTYLCKYCKWISYKIIHQNN